MPTNGRKIDDHASCCVNSRHWVWLMIAAFTITLTTPSMPMMTGHGVGVWTGGAAAAIVIFARHDGPLALLPLAVAGLVSLAAGYDGR